MRLTLAEPGYLKESIAIISDLVNEARFKVSQDAIELVAMDPANVAMVVFKLLSSAFTEYDVKKDTEMAINLGNFKQILRRASPKDMLTLELDADNRLKIELRSNTTRTFNLPIIELEEKEQKVPVLKFPVKISTNTLLFNETIEDMEVISDSVNFIVEGDIFTIQSEGNISSGKVDINNDDETNIINETDDAVKSKYSLEYLKKIAKGGKLADSVVLQFGKDYPLRVEYKITDKLLLQFILAPRVAND